MTYDKEMFIKWVEAMINDVNDFWDNDSCVIEHILKMSQSDIDLAKKYFEELKGE